MRSVRSRRPSPAVLAIVLVVALLAPIGAVVATGLAVGPVDGGDEVATSDGGDDEGGARTRDLAGEDGPRRVGDGPSMTGAGPPTTAPATTSPPTTARPPPPRPRRRPRRLPTDDGPATADRPPPRRRRRRPARPTRSWRWSTRPGPKPAAVPLRVDGRIIAAAQGHSDDMAANDYFSHDSLDGRSFADRLRAAGYPSPGGENIAQGQRSAQAVHDAWMNSSGHRANILNCGFTTIGVGLHQGSWTWTQNFGF